MYVRSVVLVDRHKATVFWYIKALWWSTFILPLRKTVNYVFMIRDVNRKPDFLFSVLKPKTGSISFEPSFIIYFAIFIKDIT